ncbi:tRNA 2-thiocytidine(32) synthetase TtcA [Klebsiella pneumoniae]|uniref:tRNA 2-thiocytidine(32) synthetase TtcA n=1 Tax=Klebsiella pneumoniae TaxID=573 RepID=A0A939NRI6_KLEPN|nr:tRNA 2-thiocytidine(32) synthetase TtcA [Klebsiella pneumoniae]
MDKLQKRLRRNVGEAIADFNMIEEGDRIMVCLSGGKDSYTMLEILRNLQKSAPISFSLVAVNLDQKQPGFPGIFCRRIWSSWGLNTRLSKRTPTASSKRRSEGKTTCSLCSRLRRGILYRTATELGATKIALGHHRDDILQTLFLNMFYGGKMKGMPPKLMSDDGKHIVIRPLAYCREKDIERFSGPKASRLFRATCAVRSQTCSAGDRRYAPRLG